MNTITFTAEQYLLFQRIYQKTGLSSKEVIEQMDVLAEEYPDNENIPAEADLTLKIDDNEIVSILSDLQDAKGNEEFKEDLSKIFSLEMVLNPEEE